VNRVQYDWFDLSPDLSLSEVGQIASEKWNVVDIKPEFVIVEENSDRSIVVPKTELIGNRIPQRKRKIISFILELELRVQANGSLVALTE
jgi:hypothetical protein